MRTLEKIVRAFLLGGSLCATPLIAGTANAEEAEHIVQNPAIEHEQEKTRETIIIDIPEYSVEIKDWKPVDITDKVKAALEGKDAELFKTDILEPVSTNGEWRFSHIVHGKAPTEYYFKDFLGTEYGIVFLFDKASKKIYTLFMGDDKTAGFPSQDFTQLRPPRQIGDSGICMYGVTWPWPEREEAKKSRAVIIADINNSRKIVFKEKLDEIHSRTPYYFQLSKKGDIAIIPRSNGFHVFDVNNLQISYQIDGILNSMDYDASVIIYNHDLGYHRLDLKTRQVKYLWRQSLTKIGFELSPDGNFCACHTEEHGPSSLDVYVHSTGEYFKIDHPIKRDFVRSVDNGGIVHARSGIYEYKDGTYVWAVEGKENPKGLSIKKVK